MLNAAVVQLTSTMDIEANLDAMEGFVREAADAGEDEGNMRHQPFSWMMAALGLGRQG